MGVNREKMGGRLAEQSRMDEQAHIKLTEPQLPAERNSIPISHEKLALGPVSSILWLSRACFALELAVSHRIEKW